MTEHPHNPEIDHSVNSTAVSLYGQDDAMDDFPVLKAFQQYIDAEQAKARKRLVSLGIFFGVLMGAVIAVFLVMLFNITERNQSLNDRLIEFAMKERNRPEAPVVVQPPVQQDNSAILQLTSKIEAMQNKLAESQKRAEEAERAQKAAAAAAAAAMAPKAPSPEELEIQRLRALLSAEKEKTALEKAKLREAELEAYRRKHYPECYATPATSGRGRPDHRTYGTVAPVVPVAPVAPVTAAPAPQAKPKANVADPESILTGKAITYFDDEDSEDEETEKKPVARKQAELPAVTNQSAAVTNVPTTYKIPVEVRGKQSSWRLPD